MPSSPPVCLLVLEQWFFAGASKLSLLLLFFVSVESVNALHLIFFLFFLVFFSNESVARRCWGMLVAYCAIVFLAIYTFSVVEPLYSFDTTRVDEGTNWIRWVGLFAADSEGSLRAFGQARARAGRAGHSQRWTGSLMLFVHVPCVCYSTS